MGEYEYPAVVGLVPEHVRVASFGLKSDYGIAGIFVERHPSVVAPCEALNLACGGGGVQGYDGIFAESGGVGGIHGATAAEYSAETVRLDGYRMMLPVDQVGRR